MLLLQIARANDVLSNAGSGSRHCVASPLCEASILAIIDARGRGAVLCFVSLASKSCHCNSSVHWTTGHSQSIWCRFKPWVHIVCLSHEIGSSCWPRGAYGRELNSSGVLRLVPPQLGACLTRFSTSLPAPTLFSSKALVGTCSSSSPGTLCNFWVIQCEASPVRSFGPVTAVIGFGSPGVPGGAVS